MNTENATLALDLLDRDMKVLLVGPIEGLPSFLYVRATVVGLDNLGEVVDLITRPSGCLLADPDDCLDPAFRDKLICIFTE